MEARYSAWPHVICGFVIVALLGSCTLGLVTVALVSAIADQLTKVTSENAMWIVVPSMFGTGVVVAAGAFAGHWRELEVRASRFCSGFLALSLAYVPLIVAKQGLQLGFAKLRRKKEPS